MSVKLHKFLASHGVASRRKSEELIEQGHVTVNGQRAHIGQRISPDQDTIVVNGKKLDKKEQKRYFAVYKPVGLISTTDDELGRKTVLSLIPEVEERLYPVGRLDRESEGLILLTNDGELTHRLTHPSNEITKVYEVLIEGKPTSKALNHLRRGVKLKEGYTQPAEVSVLSHDGPNTWLEIAIHEGMNQQVRRMLKRVGYETRRLIRRSIGPLTLEDLQDNKVQELNPQIVSQLKEVVGL